MTIIIRHRTNPMVFEWPNNCQEAPLLTEVKGKTVHFKDATSKDIDPIILCTGYVHHFSFLLDELRLETENQRWPNNLYNGVL